MTTSHLINPARKSGELIVSKSFHLAIKGDSIPAGYDGLCEWNGAVLCVSVVSRRWGLFFSQLLSTHYSLVIRRMQ